MIPSWRFLAFLSVSFFLVGAARHSLGAIVVGGVLGLAAYAWSKQ